MYILLQIQIDRRNFISFEKPPKKEEMSILSATIFYMINVVLPVILYVGLMQFPLIFIFSISIHGLKNTIDLIHEFVLYTSIYGTS